MTNEELHLFLKGFELGCKHAGMEEQEIAEGMHVLITGVIKGRLHDMIESGEFERILKRQR